MSRFNAGSRAAPQMLDLSLFSGIQFADGSVQSTSAVNTPLSEIAGKITQEQLPNPIDVGTF